MNLEKVENPLTNLTYLNANASLNISNQLNNNLTDSNLRRLDDNKVIA